MKTLVLIMIMAIQVLSFAQSFPIVNFSQTKPSRSVSYSNNNNPYYDDYKCYPMDNRKLKYAIRAIERKTFSDTQLRLAKQIASSNCLTVWQIKRIATVFSFESTKLSFVKFAYDYCYDPENYWIINDVFTFSSTVDEMDEYLYGM
jgi:hypothetical protein